MHITKIMALSVAIAALAAVSCKKKNPPGRVAQVGDQPVAIGYAIRSAIAIQDTPTLRGKAIGTLPIGNKAEIFATRVPDQKEPEKVFWYKIKYAPLGAAGDKPQMPVEGFIHEREEAIRENFLVFEKRTEITLYKEVSPDKTQEVKEPFAVMATAAVNFRRTPALNGEKIRVLKNGEVLSVLEQSTRSVSADGKHGAWFLVKDEQGATGYAFGGFLLEGSLSDMNLLKDAGFQFAAGWLTPAGNDARIYTAATGGTRVDLEKIPYNKQEWKDTKGTLATGKYLKVDGFTTKGNPQRYRFVVSTPEAGPDQFFFVDKKKVKFFRDYFAVSKAEAHKIDAALAADINRFAGGDLNLQCTKITEFSNAAAEAPRRFMAIQAHFGPNEGDAENCYTESRRILFSEIGEGKSVFYESPLSYGEFVDLDGDQVPELVSQESRRGGWSLDIFALRPDKVTPLIRLSGDGDGKIAHAEMNEKLIAIQAPFTCSDNMDAEQKKECKKDTADAKARLSMLKFDKSMPPFPFYGKLENGRFIQVAAPAH